MQNKHVSENKGLTHALNREGIDGVAINTPPQKKFNEFNFIGLLSTSTTNLKFEEYIKKIFSKELVFYDRSNTYKLEINYIGVPPLDPNKHQTKASAFKHQSQYSQQLTKWSPRFW